jgi:hypothetical protein
MKKNIFLGAVVSYDVIKEFYRDNPSFDRFVFQQMMSDGDRGNDHYRLVMYAIASDGCILNEEKPLPINKMGKSRHVKGKNVFFANIVLRKEHLEILYPKPSNSSQLKLYPIAYKDTDYVSYIAETVNSPSTTVTIDPSPPAKSISLS